MKLKEWDYLSMGYGMWMCGQLFIVYGNDGDNDYDSFGNALEE